MKNIIVSAPPEHRYPPINRWEKLFSLKLIFCGTIRGPLLVMSRFDFNQGDLAVFESADFKISAIAKFAPRRLED